MSFTNFGQIDIGNIAAIGNYGLINTGTFLNSLGDIQINRSTEWAFSNELGASFNFSTGGALKIGNIAGSGILGIFNAGSIAVSNGNVEINRVTGAGISNQVDGLYSISSIGSTKIGNIAITAGNGVENHGSFTNSGSGCLLEINRVNNIALYNLVTGTYLNSFSGSTKIGNISNSGANGIVNNGDFTNSNNGTIEVNRITSGAIVHQEGEFENLSGGTIDVGNLAGSFNPGIVISDQFENGENSTININRYTQSGIFNNDSGTLESNGDINIGDIFNSGEFGIINDGTITIESAATINIDNTSDNAIRNQIGANFANSGSILLGSTSSVGEYGIYNIATFTNTQVGDIFINRSTFNGIYNGSTFVTHGNLKIGNSGSDTSTGINNAGTFTVQNGITEVNRCSSMGIWSSGTFNVFLFGTLKVGNLTSPGQRGIVNTGIFKQNGSTSVDRSSLYGIWNQESFENTSVINIGLISSAGEYGILNEYLFSNISDECNITIDNATVSGLVNNEDGIFKVRGSLRDYSN